MDSARHFIKRIFRGSGRKPGSLVPLYKRGNVSVLSHTRFVPSLTVINGIP
jgi:hypothetical protein